MLPKWWKYIILMASFLGHLIIWGFAMSAGAFQTILLEEFHKVASVSKLSVVSSMVPALTCLVGPASSFLTNQYGCRIVGVLGSLLATAALVMTYFSTEIWHLLCSFGLLGVGLGIAYMPCIVSVYNFFDKGRPLAIALAATGLGVGSLVTPVLIRMAVDAYFWRNAMLLLAGATLNVAVLSMCFMPVQTELEGKPAISSMKRRLCSFEIFTNFSFACLFMNNFLLLFGIIAFYIHLPSHLSSIDYTNFSGAIFLSIIGAGTIVGRLTVGFVAQKFPTKPIAIYVISMTAGGLLMILVPHFKSKQVMSLLCFFFGLCTSTIGPLLPLIIVQLAGRDSMAVGYGYLLVAEGFGALCGPPFAGLLYDKNGDYSMSMVDCGLIIVLACVIMLFPCKCKSRQTSQYTTTPVEE